MYAKIFRQIFDSSLAEDYTTRHVFMDLLVLADPQGTIDMTFESIARRTNVPIDIIRESIRKLCKPDVNSRTDCEQGRRLTAIDENRPWGWKIVNFRQYHAIKDEAARREYMRLYMQKKRAEEAARKQALTLLAHKDVDVDVDVLKKEGPLAEQVGESAPSATATASAAGTAAPNTKEIPFGKPDGQQVWKKWVDAHRKRKLPDPAKIPKDQGAAKSLAKTCLNSKIDPGDLFDYMLDYLDDADPFLVKQGHPLCQLQGRLNAYIQREETLDPEPSPELFAALDAAHARQLVWRAEQQQAKRLADERIAQAMARSDLPKEK